ncbi:MAG: diguanylate cyclase [Caldilineaceae bacterium]
MRSFGPLLHFATAEAIKLTGAERGYVVLPRPNGSLDFRVKLDRQGNEVKQAEDQISKTVLTKVLQTSEPLLLRDAMADEQFSESFSVINLNLRSVMCAPLIAQGKTIGALYVENRSIRGRFKEENLLPLVLFANQAAAAIENAALNEDLEAKVIERTKALGKTMARLEAEIEERRRVEGELRRLATFDSLTDAFNRRAFFEQAELHFAQAIGNDLPLSVLMFDLDRFKQINDRFGHVAGDLALKHFATLWVCPEIS